MFEINAKNLKSGAVAGATGAGLLAGIMYAMWKTNQGPKPMFLETQQSQFGERGWIDHAAGIARFAAAGAVWGALFSVFPRPSAGRGAAFGLLPSMFLWTVIAPIQGQKPFFGGAPLKLIMPMLFNSGIWGTVVGGVASRMQNRSVIQNDLKENVLH